MANFIVGLTGGIGSGKTTVSNLFAELGVEIVDADIIARDVVAANSDALKQIVTYFGKEILLSDGTLNRPLLRKKIFANEQDKNWLNQLLHPLIRQSIILALQRCSGSYCILSAPLLFENKLNAITSRNLVIDVTIDKQIERTCQRDNNTKQQVQAIIDSQIAREQRLALADDVIDNSSDDLTQVKAQVMLLDRQYKTLATVNNH